MALNLMYSIASKMNSNSYQSKLEIKTTAFLVFLLLAVTIFSNAIAQENQAKGTVYLDANENGFMDSGEKGIEGVKVSNGVEVVKTNAQGYYTIELLPESILFISKPANYRVPLNESQLPQIYYRHYPDGTPEIADWKWPVIKPTGPLPKTIDFALLN